MGKININLKEILIFVCILIFMYIIYKSITYYDDHTVEPTLSDPHIIRCDPMAGDWCPSGVKCPATGICPPPIHCDPMAKEKCPTGVECPYTGICPPPDHPAVPNCPSGKHGNYTDSTKRVTDCSDVLITANKPTINKCNQSWMETTPTAGHDVGFKVYNLCKAQLSTDVKSSCNVEMDKLCKDRSSPEKCLECVGKNKGILGTVCDNKLVENICAKKMVCSESEECNLVQPPKLGPNKNYCCDIDPSIPPDAPPGPAPTPDVGDDCGQSGDWSDVGRRVWPIHPKNSCDCKDAFDKANKKDNNIYTAWQYTWDTPPGTYKDTNRQCSLYTGGKGTPSSQRQGSVYGEIPPPPPPSDPAIHKEGKNVCNPGWNKTDCQNIKGCKWYNTVADVCRDAPMPPQLEGNNCCMARGADKGGSLCKTIDNKTECESPAPGGSSPCEWLGPTDKCEISGLVPGGQR